MTEEQLKNILRTVAEDLRVSDTLIFLAKAKGGVFMKELFDSLTDRQIAECYLTAYDDNGYDREVEDNDFLSDIVDYAEVVRLAREFILLKMNSKNPRYDAKCPICGEAAYVYNDDSGRCFVECEDCRFRISQRNDDEPLNEMVKRFEVAEIIPKRVGLISVQCPNCGEEIEVTKGCSFFCENCHTRISKKAVEKLQKAIA